MKKKYLSLLIPVLAIVAFFGINPQKTYATAQESADFEIQPVLPTNQVDTSLNYFDLKTKPKMKQIISMRVRNFTNHKIVVHTDLRNAYTQKGGGVQFTGDIKSLDKSLKIPLTDVMKLDKGSDVIYLAPNEEKIITATLKMPNKNFKGMIYGDWHFLEYYGKKMKKSSSVTSNYAYSLGISLRGKHYKVYPDIKYKTTEAMIYNRHPAMGIKLRNTMPMVLNKVSMKGTIKNVDGGDERSFVTTNSSIAPNSEIILPISWAFDTLKPGTYKITAKIHGYNLWNKLPMDFNFKKKITIKKDNTDAINRQALKKPLNKWAVVAGATGALLLISVVELLRVILKQGA